MQFAGAKGTCIDHTIFPNATYAHSAVSATADFVLGLLPICIIWDLKMNLQTKISVGVVLSMGVMYVSFEEKNSYPTNVYIALVSAP